MPGQTGMVKVKEIPKIYNLSVTEAEKKLGLFIWDMDMSMFSKDLEDRGPLKL